MLPRQGAATGRRVGRPRGPAPEAPSWRLLNCGMTLLPGFRPGFLGRALPGLHGPRVRRNRTRCSRGLLPSLRPLGPESAFPPPWRFHHLRGTFLASGLPIPPPVGRTPSRAGAASELRHPALLPQGHGPRLPQAPGQPPGSDVDCPPWVSFQWRRRPWLRCLARPRLGRGARRCTPRGRPRSFWILWKTASRRRSCWRHVRALL